MTMPSPAFLDLPKTLRQLRLLMVTLSAGLVVLAVPVWLMTGGAAAPSRLALAVLCAVAAYGVVVTVLGIRLVKPLRPGASPHAGLGALRSITFLRTAIAESVALIGLAAAIATSNATLYLMTAPISVVLLLAVVYPRRATVEQLRRRLESGGVLSHLAEA